MQHARRSGVRHRRGRLVTMLVGASGLLFAGRAGSAPAAERTAAASSGRAPTVELPQIALSEMARRGTKYYAPLETGGEAELTLSARLQETAEELLGSYKIPLGAVAVVSVNDGRVLALAGHSDVDPSLGPALALRPWAPAASVFKVVTASALVSEAGLSAESRVCYHGGVSAVLADNLKDLPRLDQRCDTLAFGLGKSQNAIFAKLASRHLTPVSLGRVAAAFGFGESFDFEAELAPSDLFLPKAPLEFARAAAGFWQSSLTVLHGAMVAATIANGGEMPLPRLVKKAVDASGKPLPLPGNRTRRVIAPEVAREVGGMMVFTTTMGTARGSFRDPRGRPLLPVAVAGKTGSLSYRGQEGDPALPVAWPAQEHLGYSWFVGYAPADRPKVAFAVLLGNRAIWHIKAPFIARRLVAEQLVAEGELAPNSLALR